MSTQIAQIVQNNETDKSESCCFYINKDCQNCKVQNAKCDCTRLYLNCACFCPFECNCIDTRDYINILCCCCNCHALCGQQCSPGCIFDLCCGFSDNNGDEIYSTRTGIRLC
jgi:hypothetical protein